LFSSANSIAIHRRSFLEKWHTVHGRPWPTSVSTSIERHQSDAVYTGLIYAQFCRERKVPHKVYVEPNCAERMKHHHNQWDICDSDASVQGE
jgi:hypothetical protein